MIHGCQVPICILGDSAYPIQPWLLKPFTESPSMTDVEKCFNYRLSRARMVVENAFGRLKGRWRRLMKRNDMVTDHIPVVISACCILHNVCEMHGETFDDTWLQSNSESQSTPTSSTNTSSVSRPHDVRNALAEYFFAQL